MSSKRYGLLYVLPAVAALAVMQFAPMVHGLLLSLFEAGPRHTRWIGLENFRLLFTSRLFLVGLANTLRFTIATAPILIVCTFAVAIVAFGMGRRMQWFIRFTFYLPQIISAAVLSLVWTWIFNPDGALNSAVISLGGARIDWLGSLPAAFWAVVIVVVTQGLGIPIVVFLGALTSVRQELYEAAALDGAGKVRQAVAITLPLIFPVFTVQAAGLLIGGFQIWAVPYWMTGGGPAYGTYTLVLGMYREMSMFGDYGMSAAYAVTTTAALMLLILGQRRLSRCWA